MAETVTTERVYRTVDKAKWGPGPWQAEPDKIQFVDEATGLPCLIVRGGGGALCGYVGVAEGHPLFGVEYDQGPEDQLEAHGGITYSAACQAGDESRFICHIPAPGEPDHVWWFGFDCAHSGDYTPTSILFGFLSRGWETYRGVAYVRGWCARLAEQLAALAT